VPRLESGISRTENASGVACMKVQNYHQTALKIEFRISLRFTSKTVHTICYVLFAEIPKISNTQATAGSDEGSGGAGTGRGK